MHDGRMACGVICFMLGVAAPVIAQEPASPEAVRALVTLLDARRADAIAARDPSGPDRFVAVLYIPGSELLAVSNTHPAPSLLDQRLQRQEYRDVYIDLQSTPNRPGKFFVQDMAADGLRPDRRLGEPFDIVDEDGTKQIKFDGDWKAQGLSQAEYGQRFADADRRYTEMLQLLVKALQSGATASR